MDVEDQGYPSDCVGVNVHNQAYGTYNIMKCTLIYAMILDIGLKDNYTKPVTAFSSLSLHAFKSSPQFDENFNYHPTVGKLNYLVQIIRPNIMYTTHQIAKYSLDPQKEHGEAVIYIVKYSTHTQSVTFTRCNFMESVTWFDWDTSFGHNDIISIMMNSFWIIIYDFLGPRLFIQ